MNRTLEKLLLLAVAQMALQGCASSGDPLRVMLLSMADENVHNAMLRDFDTSPPVALVSRRKLPPRIYSMSNLYGMDTPSRLRLNWTYKGPPERVEIFDLAGNPPPEGMTDRFVVIVIEGEQARLGWLGCDWSNPQGYHKCQRGGVLAEPPYRGKNFFKKPDQKTELDE